MDAAAGALAVFEADDTAALLEDDDDVLNIFALAASSCCCVRDDDDDDDGSRSGGGITATGAFDVLALGVTVTVGAGLELAGARDGVVAKGRSLSDGADEVDEAAAAGAVGSEDLSSVMLFASTLSIAELARVSKLPAIVRPMELRKKRQARMPVMRVSKLPAPRADIKPDGPPPMPRAPPSERWIRINPPMLTQMMI